MKLPTKDWQPINEWAKQNGWTHEQAEEMAFASPEVDYAVSAGWVMRSPLLEKVQPLWKKISKSDQP